MHADAGASRDRHVEFFNRQCCRHNQILHQHATTGNPAAGVVAQGWNVRACGGGVWATPATYHAATTGCADFRSNVCVWLFNPQRVPCHRKHTARTTRSPRRLPTRPALREHNKRLGHNARTKKPWWTATRQVLPQNAVASAVASSSSGLRHGEQKKAVVDSDASSSSIVSVVVITKFSINMRRQEIPPPGCQPYRTQLQKRTIKSPPERRLPPRRTLCWLGYSRRNELSPRLLKPPTCLIITVRGTMLTVRQRSFAETYLAHAGNGAAAALAATARKRQPNAPLSFFATRRSAASSRTDGTL